ncbi:DUF4829 domain-containing protein [Clostridium botulinum]|nr:DUF4829 domain-containing protein [Clostridium botulinum]NFN47070.1 DUF4829 domain-containing protein [Clostridium botulinum]
MRGFKSRILILLIFTILILVVGCRTQKVNDTKSENECVVEENFIKSINLSGAIKSPEDSGEYEKLFTLIRENNLGEWKIDGIGES